MTQALMTQALMTKALMTRVLMNMPEAAMDWRRLPALGCAWVMSALLLQGCASVPSHPSPAVPTGSIYMPAPGSIDAPMPSPQGVERALGSEVVIRAISLLGAPYKFGGSGPRAFDCSGLVHYVFGHAIGLALPRNAEEISRVGEQIGRDELEPGDLVFFNTLRRPFSHVGIYLGEQRFIHAPSHGGQVEIVSMIGRYWQPRYDGARRISF